MNLKLDQSGKRVAFFASISYIICLVFLKFSGFSTASIVNFSNHIIKSMIFSASTGTWGALNLLFTPFLFVLTALVFLTLAISILAYYRSEPVANASGIAAALAALVLFPTVAGIFLALALFLCSYASRVSVIYAKEMKKWVGFRLGSNTVGKALMIANVLIAIGVFSSVIVSQSNYENSFREELRSSVSALALSLPGASAMSPEALDERVSATAETLSGSRFFAAYIAWLPISSAFMTWIILEFLRNLVFANLGGLFTSLMFRRHQP